MSQPIIYTEGGDFQGDLCTYVTYKGEPVTGTVIDQDDIKGGKAVVELKDGYPHGHTWAYDANGRMLSDIVFDEGNFVSQKEWYEDGSLKNHWTPDEERWWDKSGTLAKVNDSWLYTNGQKINEQQGNSTLYFSPTGELAIKHVKIELRKENPYQLIYYFDHVIYGCYEELFTNLYPGLDEPFSRGQLLMPWVSAVYCEDKERGLHLLEQLTAHPNQQIRDQAHALKQVAMEQRCREAARIEIHEAQPDHIIIKLHFDTRL